MLNKKSLTTIQAITTIIVISAVGLLTYYDTQGNEINVNCSTTLQQEISSTIDELAFVNESICADYPINKSCSKRTTRIITNHITKKSMIPIKVQGCA